VGALKVLRLESIEQRGVAEKGLVSSSKGEEEMSRGRAVGRTWYENWEGNSLTGAVEKRGEGGKNLLTRREEYGERPNDVRPAERHKKKALLKKEAFEQNQRKQGGGLLTP